MNDHLPYLLGYPASFCERPVEARDNLWRMICAEIPGWHGGPAVWAERLRVQLSLPNRTRKLNRYGARFTATEWVWLMQSLLAECERRLPLPPPSAALAGQRRRGADAAPMEAPERDPTFSRSGSDPDALQLSTAGLRIRRSVSA